MPYEITRGKQLKALKVLIYGVEGVGKTTFAAQFPDPLFIDCEGGTDNYDVARFPRPTSWEQLLQEVQQVIHDPSICRTLVIDTIDWAEQEAIRKVCAEHQVNGIEDFGWSKGYTYLHEEMGKLLNLLTEVRDAGINVVLTAHMSIRTSTLPDDSGAYDRYELKLKTAKNGNNSQLVKEWADMVLFLNFKQFVVKDEKTKKSKITGGRERVMYANHTAAFDAKNRFGLPDELPLSFEQIAKLFASAPEKKAKDLFGAKNVEVLEEERVADQPPQDPVSIETIWQPIPYTPQEEQELKLLNPKLVDLMRADNVHESEIQAAVVKKEYMPKGMPIKDYPPEFVEGCLIAAWPQVFAMIKEERDLPF